MRPKIRVEIDEARVVAYKLAKAGYANPQEILAMPADLVLEMVDYERFTEEYSREVIRLNQRS